MPNTPILNLPYPTSADTADVPRDMQALALAIDPLGTVPIGGLMLWPVALAPAAWLLCQGQQVDAALYPALALVLGQVAGKITIPDLTDRFPAGPGPTNGALLAPGGSAQMPAHTHVLTDPGHTHATDAQGSHSHGGNTGAADRTLDHQHTFGGWTVLGASSWAGAGLAYGSTYTDYIPNNPQNLGNTGPVNGSLDHLHAVYTDVQGSHGHNVLSKATGATVAAAGAGPANENRPPFRVVNFIIRSL